MLNERERRVLARIERHLAETDPDLVRLFTGGPLKRGAASSPRVLLVIGLVLLVLGSAAAVIPVAMFGVSLAVVALFLAYLGPAGFGSPRTA